LIKKGFFLLFYVLFSFASSGQNLFLADRYLKEGETEKALRIYLDWYDKFRRYSPQVYDNVLDIYIRQGRYDQALEWVERVSRKSGSGIFEVDKYHLFTLKKESDKARRQKEKLKQTVTVRPAMTSAIVYRLKKYNYLDDAVALLKLALQTKATANLYLLLGTTYAELGQTEQMMEAYLQSVATNDVYFHYLTSFLAKFIDDNPSNKYNRILKRKLAEKIARRPLPVWLKLMQWIYVRERNYNKAFVQLRGLYLQNQARPREFVQLAESAYNARQYEEAEAILQFTEQIPELTENDRAEIRLLFTKIENQTRNNNDTLIREWKRRARITSHAKIRAEIYEMIIDKLVFDNKNYESARKLTDSLIQTERNPKIRSRWREKKADILLLTRRFDAAAIEYTLLREDFPYDEINYNALYKIALASFFSGDFDWAHTTLKNLKKAADKKVANDALWLDFVIIANREAQDTIHEGLKEFASAYFDYYAKNYSLALEKIKNAQPRFKGQKIHDDFLYLKAKILWKSGKITETSSIWEEILSHTHDNIYREEALYRLGIIYARYLDNPDKASEYLKKLLTEHPQSFWFEPAQKLFREIKENQGV